MNLPLTPQEQKDLIFQEGDYFEIISGSISTTTKKVGPTKYSSHEVTHHSFFFETSDVSWTGIEWKMSSAGDIPDGPALLVLYRRERSACAFGLISMINRAWIHAVPLMSIDFIRESPKAKELQRLMVKSVMATSGAAVAAHALSKFTLGFGKNKLAENIAKHTNKHSYRDESEQIEATARHFMYRLSKSADEYWEGDGENSMSGKL